MIRCTNYPNVYIHTFRKRWSLIWMCFFLVSNLKRRNVFLFEILRTLQIERKILCKRKNSYSYGNKSIIFWKTCLFIYRSHIVWVFLEDICIVPKGNIYIPIQICFKYVFLITFHELNGFFIYIVFVIKACLLQP